MPVSWKLVPCKHRVQCNFPVPCGCRSSTKSRRQQQQQQQQRQQAQQARQELQAREVAQAPGLHQPLCFRQARANSCPVHPVQQAVSATGYVLMQGIYCVWHLLKSPQETFDAKDLGISWRTDVGLRSEPRSNSCRLCVLILTLGDTYA